MRYVLFFLLLHCAVLTSSAKEYKSDSLVYSSINRKEMKLQQKYEQTANWERFKKLKRYAFGTLGLGVCGTVVGWIGEISNTAYTNSNWKNDGKAWDIILGVGIGLTISSIPLFVVSHKNKRKAKEAFELSLKGSNVSSMFPNGMEKMQPALGVCISF